MKFLTFFSFLLICMVFSGFAEVPAVRACSGGATDTIQALLANATYVAKADVVSVDEVRQNAILHVDSYLYGGAGPEYLMLVQNDPVVINRIIQETAYNYCDFFGNDLNPGLTAYFFVTRRPDGAYKATTAAMPTWATPTYYDFAGSNSSVMFYSQKEDVFTEHELNEQTFVEFITQHGESTVLQPIDRSTFPRLSPLRIKTTLGTDYLLPVDTDFPVKITDDFLQEMTGWTLGNADSPMWNAFYFDDANYLGVDCMQVSPNGFNCAWQEGDQMRWIGGQATGQAVSFSSTGEIIAVWNNDKLELYIYDQPSPNSNYYRVLQSITLSNEDGEQIIQSAWTPDGRSFAYSDNSGLWLLADVYDEGLSPILLLPNEGAVPTALRFSPLGHYLQIERGEERFTLDIYSGYMLPDGLVSPDDRFLLAYDTSAEFFDIQMCSLTPLEECQIRHTPSVEIGIDDSRAYTRYQKVQWRNVYSFFSTVCATENQEDCIVSPVQVERLAGNDFWRHMDFEWNEGYSFDYSSSADLLTIVKDDYLLNINGQEYDIAASLDSPIVSVEWLPSLFYKAADFQ
jgi:hypothetical protein